MEIPGHDQHLKGTNCTRPTTSIRLGVPKQQPDAAFDKSCNVLMCSRGAALVKASVAALGPGSESTKFTDARK
eukprot:131827-Amphidinium_carterae.1